MKNRKNWQETIKILFAKCGECSWLEQFFKKSKKMEKNRKNARHKGKAKYANLGKVGSNYPTCSLVYRISSQFRTRVGYRRTKWLLWHTYSLSFQVIKVKRFRQHDLVGTVAMLFLKYNRPWLCVFLTGYYTKYLLFTVLPIAFLLSFLVHIQRNHGIKCNFGQFFEKIKRYISKNSFNEGEKLRQICASLSSSFSQPFIRILSNQYNFHMGRIGVDFI